MRGADNLVHRVMLNNEEDYYRSHSSQKMLPDYFGWGNIPLFSYVVNQYRYLKYIDIFHLKLKRSHPPVALKQIT